MKLIGGIAISIMVFGIYLSGSNTAMLGALAALFIIFIFSNSKPRRMMVLVLLIILVVVLLLYIYMESLGGVNSIAQSIERNINRARDITFDVRVDIYLEAIEELKENPIIGFGYDQIPTSGIPVCFLCRRYCFSPGMGYYLHICWSQGDRCKFGSEENVISNLLGHCRRDILDIIDDANTSYSIS